MRAFERKARSEEHKALLNGEVFRKEVLRVWKKNIKVLLATMSLAVTFLIHAGMKYRYLMETGEVIGRSR